MAIDNVEEGDVDVKKTSLSEGIFDLVSGLEQLSVVGPDKDVRGLEDTLATVSLHDDHTQESDAEENHSDGENTQEGDVQEEVADKADIGCNQHIPEEKQPKDTKKTKDEEEKDSENTFDLQEKENNIVAPYKSEDEEDHSCDENEPDDPEETETKAAGDEDHSCDENEPDDEFAASEKKSKPRAPCVRGLGQTMQNYPYPGQTYGIDSFGVTTFSQPLQQSIPPKAYSPDRSPQYASSPGFQTNYLPDQSACGFLDDSPVHHPNMSPVYNMYETNLHSPLMIGSYQNESGFFSPGFGLGQGNYLPETPPPSHLDENEMLQMPSPEYMSEFTPTSEHQHSFNISSLHEDTKLEALFEAIDRVERSNSQSRPVPYEDLVAITESLKSCEEMKRNHMVGSTADIEEILELATKNIQKDSPVDLINYNRKAIIFKAAEINIKNQLDHQQLTLARKKMAAVKNEQVVAKDADGDVPSMIVACEDLSKPTYMENLVAIEERQRGIDICCDFYIKKGERCNNCGNDTVTSFYSTLAMKNNDGDTVLSSTIKLNYPVSVINFICEKLVHRSADVQRVFDEESSYFYRRHEQEYPILKHLLDMAEEMRNFCHFEAWGNNM